MFLYFGSSENAIKNKYGGVIENFGVYSKTKENTKINITLSDDRVTKNKIMKK